MKHRISVKKLNKKPSHRKAMIRNMLVALFREERIKTTHAKAKVLKRFAEKLITRARKDGVHNRRMAAKWVQDKAILNKLFTDIALRYLRRPGGYTRIVKIGPRYGDASEMAYILLVVDDDEPIARAKKKNTKQVQDAMPQNPEQKPMQKAEEEPDNSTEQHTAEDVSHTPSDIPTEQKTTVYETDAEVSPAIQTTDTPVDDAEDTATNTAPISDTSTKEQSHESQESS